MAKKSKTQKAKASAARQARKAERESEQMLSAEGDKPTSEDEGAASQSDSESKKPSISSKLMAKKSDDAPLKKKDKSDDKPKKQHFKFLKEVRSELKRVTWPTRIDVLRWSGIVVVALVFFGVFTAVLDNLIVTPLLVLISGADPASIDWMSVFTGSEGSFDASSSADASAGGDASSSDASTADVQAASDADASSADAATDAQDASADETPSEE